MAFKKVIVNELEKCSKCEGTSGLEYSVKKDIPYSIKWGERVSSIQKDKFYPIIAKTPKTAKCIDCGKRVEFEISNLCPVCEKPRGRDEDGSLVCPCPHCGDSVPF